MPEPNKKNTGGHSLPSDATSARRSAVDRPRDGGALDLDSLGEPAIAVDRAGLVMNANTAMRSLLGEDISIHNNRLCLSDSAARRRLEDLIRALKANACPSDIEPIVLKCDDESPIILRMMTIPENAQGLFLGASAVLVFARLRRWSQPSAQLLSRIFGLTPAESRLAAALSDGSTLIEAAKALNISWETARTQLKAVFAKTNTHRQSELVALLSRL